VVPVPVCPVHSSYVNGQCVCNDGFKANGSICVVDTLKYCQNNLGPNSFYKDSMGSFDTRIATNFCQCENGYEIKSNKCVEQEHRKVSSKAKQWADSSRGPCGGNDLGLPDDEIKECTAYQLWKHLYNWDVYDSNKKIVSTAPVIVQQPISVPVSDGLPVPQNKQETKIATVIKKPEMVKNKLVEQKNVDIKTASSSATTTTFASRTTHTSTTSPIKQNAEPEVSFFGKIKSFMGKLNPFSWF